MAGLEAGLSLVALLGVALVLLHAFPVADAEPSDRDLLVFLDGCTVSGGPYEGWTINGKQRSSFTLRGAILEAMRECHYEST